MMPNSRIPHKRSQHGELDMVRIVNGAGVTSEQRRQDGDEADAH